MSLTDVEDNVDDATPHTKRVSIFIGVLAVLLAFTSLGGGNTTKDAGLANVSATNTWSFFQAKNLRRNEVNLAADNLRVVLATQLNLTEAGRKRFIEYVTVLENIVTDAVSATDAEPAPKISQGWSPA